MPHGVLPGEKISRTLCTRLAPVREADPRHVIPWNYRPPDTSRILLIRRQEPRPPPRIWSPKSEIYQEFLPLLNSRRAALLKHDGLERQLLLLERRTSRGGRDAIDHPRGGRDDLANAVAGALVMVQRGPSAAAALRFRRQIEYSDLGIV
jgi:hypothetical protein